MPANCRIWQNFATTAASRRYFRPIPPRHRSPGPRFATGKDPGGTAIFDFLKRDPDDYLPDFAMNSESRKTFLYGERNPLVFGLVGGALCGFVGAGYFLAGP